MTKHKATISRSGEVLADQIEVWLELKLEESGMPTWHGAFFAPLDSAISVFGSRHANFRLRLDDGREGEFFIKRQAFGTHKPNTIQFQGTGPLARSTPN